MDKNRELPWSKRVKFVRYASKYTLTGFSLISGISRPTLINLESGMRPRIDQIRKIRQLERIFAHELELFHHNVRKFGGVKHAAPEIVKHEYRPYAGTLTRKRTVHFGRGVVPTDPADILALGGMEVISRARGVQGRSSREVSQAERARRIAFGKKLAESRNRNRRGGEDCRGETQDSGGEVVTNGSILVEDSPE